MGIGKIGRKAIRLAIKTLDTAVLIIILLFIAVDCYAVWDARQAYTWAEAAHYEIYKPDAQTQDHSFEELGDINPEVFAWLSVYGTRIDYPVVQGSDNQKYINTNALGQYSLSGAIFLDARCSKAFLDFPSIVYGHHMEKNAMFGEIGNFADKEYFDARPYGSLYYSGEEHGLEIFAFLHCDAYDTRVFRTRIAEREEREVYLALLLERATYTRHIGVTPDDRIVLLSTCSSGSTNGRDILAGRIMDKTYENGFLATDTGKLFVAGRLTGLWARVPLWGKIAVFSLLPLLLLFMIHKKGERRI